ncbi:response regulator transcription factor [Stenotrophomonas sp. GD03908]|uniref:Response regulator transcription factor n=1 Tax=Stenotrophomonas maltophilia TaxID=40324 RepID=A0AAJ2TPQ3_STEMA|nr:MULTISPECIES: response regulator transcription factor [Stenotrophomonas]MBH1482481.1 response regulator transcription factor [Stenotrophomonas maltophilia]MCU1064243.1 response regulator transcription factor [Stenotrophomonas maltophilia]MDH0980559.1 response regulator transcription factor [Stenotrophomonas sp. GD03908]MDQ7294650.1 response regulator transcription factor [Stenotrophomonas sp. Sm0041]MDZ5766160.1 response regulator transcription factor [Stenotrophomonas maltophilia]
MHPRIIIADDHPVVLHGIRIVLQTHLMNIVGSARDGAQLLELLDNHPCDAVLTDLSMPGTGPDGPELIDALHTRYPGLPVVVLTGARHPGLLDGLLREGVSGLVDKCADFSELPQALNAALVGQVFVSQQLRHHLQARDLLFPREPAPLSAREQEVLDLLAAGLSVNAVAARCGRSPKTISRQKAEAKRKLGLQNNQELFDYLQTRRD